MTYTYVMDNVLHELLFSRFSHRSQSMESVHYRVLFQRFSSLSHLRSADQQRNKGFPYFFFSRRVTIVSHFQHRATMLPIISTATVRYAFAHPDGRCKFKGTNRARSAGLITFSLVDFASIVMILIGFDFTGALTRYDTG